jgi:hypothetical protein
MKSVEIDLGKRINPIVGLGEAKQRGHKATFRRINSWVFFRPVDLIKIWSVSCLTTNHRVSEVSMPSY